MNDPTDDMLCLQDFDETVADFYRLTSPKVPWGDYGRILVHGISGARADDARSPELQRTGPFVPPISLPGLGCIVVTDSVRHELQASGLIGLAFIPVIKKTIVPIDWHDWDLLGDAPPLIPDDGEPESYLSEIEHSPELARRMPELWRPVVGLGATELRAPESADRPDQGRRTYLRANSWNGADFFRANTTLHNYVSPRARQWLLDRYPAWISFQPVQTK